jgi:hypothetical protein
MKAAIYSRFSADKQAEAIIFDQVRVCTECVRKRVGLSPIISRIRASSGAAIGNRPGCVAKLSVYKRLEGE